MRRIALCFALFAALCAQAKAAVTVVTLGNKTNLSGSTSVLTTSSNACPVGSLIVLLGTYSVVADTLNSVVDSAGNTWQTPIDNTNTTSVGQGIAYAKNTTANLPIGGTITATFAGSTANGTAAVCVSNADPVTPLDTNNHTATGLAQTAATTVNTGTLGNATAIIIGAIAFSGSSSTITCAGSFALTESLTGQTPSLGICTQIVSSTGSVAFSPTWVTSRNYVSDVVSFQGVSVKSAAMTMTGVGP